MPRGLPRESTLVPTATKSPFNAAATQSPWNVPPEGLTAACQRKDPVAVYDVTARSRPADGPETTATLPKLSVAIRAAWPALSVPAERPPPVHRTGSVVTATTGLARTNCMAREMLQPARKRRLLVLRFPVEVVILFIVLPSFPVPSVAFSTNS